MNTMRVRFAPSPTGYLHVGNVRTALLNYLFCRQHKGIFLLRIDDTDQERSKPEYEEAIYQDLAWLGISHDETARQSTRFERYQKATDHLKSAGRLYPCYETQEELAFKRKMQLAQGRPPQYDRAGLHLTDDQKHAYEQQGRKPHWRFKIADEAIDWHDLVRGPVHFEGAHLSDPVLIREDGQPIYTLASVVDDCEMAVTHIIRGEDHVANTAIQIQLIQALGHDPQKFHFAHMPLISDDKGEGLSKRLGSAGIRTLKEEGLLPMALSNVLARLGTSQPIEAFDSLDPLIKSFSFDLFARSTPKFSFETVQAINAKLLHEAPLDQIKPYLPESMNLDASTWKTLQKNLNSLQDLPAWQQILAGDFSVSFSEEDQSYLKIALDLLPPSNCWGEDPWTQWQNTLKEKTNRKGGKLLKPLRLALTGLDHGPELGKLVKLLGYEEIKKRLDHSISI